MKYLIILFLVSLTLNMFSQDYNYLVKCNDKSIDQRYYKSDTLNSIVEYNGTDANDSITYNGENIVWYHNEDKSGLLEDSLHSYLYKFYYPYFDKSLQTNHIYSLVKHRLLIEDVLWAIAAIDDEMSLDSTLLSQNRIINQDEKECHIIYKIDSRCLLHQQLFEITYRVEILKTLNVYIKNGFLVKLFFEGEETDKTVTFEYKDNYLTKEEIQYFNHQNGELEDSEEYTYYRNK